jgi:hypothetical protein
MRTRLKFGTRAIGGFHQTLREAERGGLRAFVERGVALSAAVHEPDVREYAVYHHIVKQASGFVNFDQHMD